MSQGTRSHDRKLQKELLSDEEVVSDSDDQASVYSVTSEDIEALVPHEEHPAVKKRIKKQRKVVSKEYANSKNAPLVDEFYRLGRAFFKDGDIQRGLHYSRGAKALRLAYIHITSGAQASEHCSGVGPSMAQKVKLLAFSCSQSTP